MRRLLARIGLGVVVRIARVNLAQHSEDRHLAVAGLSQGADHPQPAELGRPVTAVLVRRVARHLDQAVALPAPQHID